MAVVPSGTVTFLFTDIQGSTKLWQEDPAAMDVALRRHDDILSKAVSQNNGHVFKTVGDAFCCAFTEALDAIRTCLAVQFIIREQEWKTPRPIRVRMSLHTGAARERDNDYFGPPVNKVARIESLAHGGQVIMSLATAELVRETLPEGASLEDKGTHRLKDLNRPEQIFQLNHTEMPSVFPPLKSMDVLPNNLPVQTTPLIGREKELAEVHELLKKDDCRLVSLVGPGGMGKTRMSLQLAADLVDENRDGTWFVDLSTITLPEGVALETGKALSIPQKPDVDPVEQIAEALGNKQLLIVLDNFEQVMSAYEVVMTWLHRSPGVRFIVTSREPLNVRGEHVYHIPPLTTPKALGASVLSQFEATRLFIERAVAGKPDFQVNNENAPVVAEICSRLDGIPLAIELAAARIRLLNPKAILKRLDTRLKLLTGGPNDMPDRHKTLRACIDWSYDLLNDEERVIYRSISVFNGGISLEGAVAVLEPVMDDELEVLDGLESLVDKSIVYRKGPMNDEPFFGILETIAEYGRARLVDAGEEQEYLDRHAGYFLSVVMNAEEAWDGPEQKLWIDRITANEENIRHAMNRLFETDEGMAVIAMTKAMVPFWIMCSRLAVCREWLWTALNKCEDPECGEVAWLTMQMGWLGWASGNYEEADHYLSNALTIFGAENETAGYSECLYHYGQSLFLSNQLDESEEKLKEAYDIARQEGFQSLEANAKLVEGNISWRRGRLDEAERAYQSALDAFVLGGNHRREAEVYNNLSVIKISEGNYSEAEAILDRTIPKLEEFSNYNYLRYAVSNLGELRLRQRRYSEALTSFEKIKNLALRSLDYRYVSNSFSGIAEAYVGLGEIELAELCALQALEYVKKSFNSIEYGIAKRIQGDIFRVRGKYKEAFESYSQAEEISKRYGEEEELEKISIGKNKMKEQ